jgi:hypothetical protein
MIASVAIGMEALLDMGANGRRYHHPLFLGISSRNEASTFRCLSCMELIVAPAGISTVCSEGVFGSMREMPAGASNSNNYNNNSDDIHDDNN